MKATYARVHSFIKSKYAQLITLCLALKEKAKNFFGLTEQDLLNSQDEDFIADSKAALLIKTTPAANVILYTVIALLIVGLIWAYFAPIDQVTIGEGKVVPSTQVKNIQSLDGGILAAIYVKEGDTVKQGQVIAKLDETRYKADYQQSYARYLALSAMVARLTAETNNQSTITFPTDLIEHQDLIKRETQQFKTRKEAFNNGLTTLQHSYDLANSQLAIIEPMVKKGIVPKIEYLRTQREANEIKSRILNMQDQFHEDAWSELNQRKADLNIVKESLAALQDKMQRTTVHSPVNGIVKKIFINTIEGVITPGMSILDIVPMEDTLLVETKVLPSDIAFIHPGQPANVQITAYDYSIFGSLKGTVEYISPDAIEENKPNQGNTITNYYRVNIRTTTNYLGNEQHKLPIIPGMTAVVHIQTGQKTILQYLLKPLIKAKQEALRER